MSVLSRYYFVFLLAAFVFLGGIYFRAKNLSMKGQRAVIVLFVIFTIAILALEENFLGIASWDTLLFGVFVLAFVFGAFFAVKRFYPKACPLLINITLFLLTLGFIYLQRLNPTLATRQFIFAVVAFLASMLIPLIFRVFKNFEKMEVLFLGICGFMLLMVPMASAIGTFLNIPLTTIDQFGAARWIGIGNLTFQPSEFATLPFLLFLSCAFRIKPTVPKLAFVSIATASIIIFLVLQRNLGGALMYFMVFMVMLYGATGNKLLFAGGFGAMSIASVAAYHIFPHIQVRVATFANPWAYISGIGFQITQSIFAFITWGPFGAGLLRGMPHRIPVVERDIIFSAISEEFGWLFGLLLMGVYILLLFKGLDMAKRATRPIHSMMALAFTTFLAFQAFVSIAGNIGFIPLTGVTLPFVSYGGSSVFVCILMMGILNWINSDTISQLKPCQKS